MGKAKPVKPKAAARKKSGPKGRSSPKGRSAPRQKRSSTLKELGESTGFSYRQLKRFVSLGMPHSKRKRPKGGRPLIYTDLAEAVTWLSGKGIATPDGKGKAVEETARAMAEQVSKEAQDPEKNPAADDIRSQIDQKLLNSLGLCGALERMKLQEFNASRLLIRRLNEGASKDELASIEKLHTKTCVALRATEFAVLEYRQKHGELVLFGQMVTAWERIAVGFKNAVQGIPSTAAPRIRGLLKDPENDIDELMTILSEEAHRALTSLPNEIPTGSNNESDSGGDAESTA